MHTMDSRPSAQLRTKDSVQAVMPVSSIRRKPRITYKSPSGEDLSSSTPLTSILSVPKHASTSIADPLIVPRPSLSTNSNAMSVRRKNYSMGPPLPLYHPLGRLALSLPPLDPANFGLPVPVRSDDAGRRSSSRARRPAAKLREIEEDALTPFPTVTAIAAVAAREVKDKPSPRKRRTGGGGGNGGGGSKRKRKEPDDGDAPYPAKRTRAPRGGANQVAEDESPPDSAVPAAEVTPTPDGPSETPEEKRPERRSTRSRGAVKRRDSSASEATSVSMSVVAAAAAGPGKLKDVEPMEVDKKSDTEEPQNPGDGRNEKEEGEMSEESTKSLRRT